MYSAHVFESNFGENADTPLQVQTQLETFILDFRLDNNFVYRFVIAVLGDILWHGLIIITETSCERMRSLRSITAT